MALALRNHHRPPKLYQPIPLQKLPPRDQGLGRKPPSTPNTARLGSCRRHQPSTLGLPLEAQLQPWPLTLAHNYLDTWPNLPPA